MMALKSWNLGASCGFVRLSCKMEPWPAEAINLAMLTTSRIVALQRGERGEGVVVVIFNASAILGSGFTLQESGVRGQGPLGALGTAQAQRPFVGAATFRWVMVYGCCGQAGRWWGRSKDRKSIPGRRAAGLAARDPVQL